MADGRTELTTRDVLFGMTDLVDDLGAGMVQTALIADPKSNEYQVPAPRDEVKSPRID